jgi:bifunctional UDP-N-acetylglucosamine pyrophosphorylase/glucosamine-1-phosphate N-acetyltransferase
MDKVQIIILAAGKGTRMKSEGPKALTLFKNKPFLEHILETIETLRLPAKPIIVVGYKKEQILEVIGDAYTYAHQDEQLGTGHAVMSAKQTVDPKSTTIVVISADQPLISKETILKIITTHLEEKPVITLAIAALPDFMDWRRGMERFGRIIRDKNGELKNMVEYKDATDEEKDITEVNAAVYAFDSAWLWNNIHKLNRENVQGEYYITDLIRLACNQGEKIKTVPVANLLEMLQPNSKEELEILEKLAV